jgi:hypothetical protein
VKDRVLFMLILRRDPLVCFLRLAFFFFQFVLVKHISCFSGL